MMPILRSGQRHMNQKSSGMGDDGWLDVVGNGFQLVVGLLADCFCFGRILGAIPESLAGSSACNVTICHNPTEYDKSYHANSSLLRMAGRENSKRSGRLMQTQT